MGEVFFLKDNSNLSNSFLSFIKRYYSDARNINIFVSEPLLFKIINNIAIDFKKSTHMHIFNIYSIDASINESKNKIIDKKMQDFLLQKIICEIGEEFQIKSSSLIEEVSAIIVFLARNDLFLEEQLIDEMLSDNIESRVFIKILLKWKEFLSEHKMLDVYQYRKVKTDNLLQNLKNQIIIAINLSTRFVFLQNLMLKILKGKRNAVVFNGIDYRCFEIIENENQPFFYHKMFVNKACELKYNINFF